MMGKIISEAAHSIIGMLSAKPLDMETRTANNEFSSLLLPGENRVDLGLDNDGADKVDDKTSEQFLELLTGNDGRPAPVTSDRAATNITLANMTEQRQPDMNVGRSTQLPVSETGADKSKNKLGDVAKIPTGPLISVDGPSEAVSTVTPVSSAHISKDIGFPQNSEKQAVESKSPAAFKPLIETRSVIQNKPTVENRPPRDSKTASSAAIEMSKAVSVENTTVETVQKTSTASTYIPAKPYTDAEMVKRSAANHMNGKAPVTGAASADIFSGRTATGSLGQRLTSGVKAESSALRPVSELDVRGPTVTVDKPMKIETTIRAADMENISAVAAPLDRNIELPGPMPAIMVSELQNVTQKSVHFDWNAPQFAERFASEISDLKINGDLKKFEINPRNMGRLEVSFVTRGGAEILQIEAENDAAREMILQHSQAIQDMLKSQGRSDLTLRVDVRDNMLGAPQNNSMNFSQQDSGQAQQNHSARQHNGGIAMPTETDSEPTGPSDNSRYA